MLDIERIAGESDEAASALALWAQGLTIDQIAARLKRPKVRILAYKQDYRWDERCVFPTFTPPPPPPIIAPREVPPIPQMPAPAPCAPPAPLPPITISSQNLDYTDEIAATIARIERSQEGLKTLQQAQFALGLEIIKKLLAAMKRLDSSLLKPRDIGPLLAAATRATDGAWNNLANIEGVNAFLEAAVKAQRAHVQTETDDDEDGDE